MNIFSFVKHKLLPPLSVLTILFGGVAWLTALHASTIENTKAIVQMEAKQDAYLQLLIGIRSDLAEVQGELKRKPNREDY